MRSRGCRDKQVRCCVVVSIFCPPCPVMPCHMPNPSFVKYFIVPFNSASNPFISLSIDTVVKCLACFDHDSMSLSFLFLSFLSSSSCSCCGSGCDNWQWDNSIHTSEFHSVPSPSNILHHITESYCLHSVYPTNLLTQLQSQSNIQVSSPCTHTVSNLKYRSLGIHPFSSVALL